MSTYNTERTEPEETRGSDDADRSSRPRRLLSTVARRGRNGTVAALAGGLLVAGAVRMARRDRPRAGVLALAGGALLGVGVRQRRPDGESDAATGSDEGEVSADAGANLERSDVLHQSETNPRGVSGEPDVDAETGPGEGDIQFSTEHDDEEAEPKPSLDTEEDPRLNDGDGSGTTDDHVDIDLSEAAMADEASEAAGPADEQSYPAMEGTDPEPTADEAPQRYGEGAVGNTDADAGDRPSDENPGTEGASEDDEETT